MASDPDNARPAPPSAGSEPAGVEELRRVVFDHAVARSVWVGVAAEPDPARIAAIAAATAPIERIVAALKLIWRAEEIADPAAPLSTPQEIDRLAAAMGLSAGAWPERWRDIAARSVEARRGR